MSIYNVFCSTLICFSNDKILITLVHEFYLQYLHEISIGVTHCILGHEIQHGYFLLCDPVFTCDKISMEQEI